MKAKQVLATVARNEEQQFAVDEFLTKIAQEILDIKTLKDRGRDHLDFHEVGVHTLKKALHATFVGGFEAGFNAGWAAGKNFSNKA